MLTSVGKVQPVYFTVGGELRVSGYRGYLKEMLDTLAQNGAYKLGTFSLCQCLRKWRGHNGVWCNNRQVNCLSWL